MTADLDKHIEQIAASGLFDADYYCLQVPVARQFDQGPIAHYLLEGFLAGIRPHVLFDPEVYSESSNCPQDAAPLLHYLGTTGTEAFQTHPLFDVRFYLGKYPDLAECAAKINPLWHFVNHGGQEGRDPHILFSSKYYLRQYQNLHSNDDQSVQCINPLVHYLQNSELSPHELFDTAYYKQHASAHSINSLIHFLANSNEDFVSPHPIFNLKYYLAQLPANEEVSNPLVHFLTSQHGIQLSPHPLFDVNEYGRMRPDLLEAKLHLFMHYIRDGYREWCKQFSLFQAYHPNHLFHGQWYLSKHPELLENSTNPLLHYALHRDIPHPFFEPDYYKQKYELAAEDDALADCLLHGRIEKIDCVEPLLGSSACKKQNSTISAFDTAFDALKEMAAPPFTRLFVVLGLLPGNPARMLTTNISALQKKHGIEKVLVIYSYLGEENAAPPWLPAASRAVDAAALLAGNPDDHALLIAALIHGQPPAAVHIVESYPLLVLLTDLWKTFSSLSCYVLYLYGHGVYLNDSDPKYWYYNIKGPSIGQALRLFDCVITDAEIMRQTIKEKIAQRSQGGRKTFTLRSLIPDYLDSLLAQSLDRVSLTEGHVLWASRISEVKRPDILAAIARALPEYTFVVYGSVDSDREYGKRWVEILQQMANVQYRGPYKDFGALAHRDALAFLYTTETDGVPLVLEEAAALGLPLVAPRVGGIPELVSNETGWLIERYDDIGAYIDAIHSIARNPEQASDRVKAARALLQRDFGHEALERICELNPEIF